MATKHDILETIAGFGQPARQSEIANSLGVKVSDISQQVKDYTKAELLVRGENNDYSLSDAGTKWLGDERDRATKFLAVKSPDVGAMPPGTQPTGGGDSGLGDNSDGQGEELPPETSAEAARRMPSEEQAGLTDYEYFYALGLQVGISPQTSDITTRHVWRGGQYQDLEWVWKGLTEMQIRPDLSHRWWHAWRTYLHQGIPTQLKPLLGSQASATQETTAESKTKAEAEAKKLEKPVLTHIIRDDSPVFVGEGQGDMTYEDAKHLCESRTAAKARTGSTGATGGQSLSSYGDELAKIIKSVRELDSERGSKGKSYLITPGNESEEATITEVDNDKPLIVPERRPPAPQAGQSFIVHDDGTTEQLEPNRPIVIVQKPREVLPPTTRGKSYVYDKETGQMTEVSADAPVIIYGNQPRTSGDNPVIPFVSPDGKPFTLDLKTYFALEEHKQKMESQKASDDLKLGLGKELKKVITKATNAFAHMAGEEPDEEEEEPQQ